MNRFDGQLALAFDSAPQVDTARNWELWMAIEADVKGYIRRRAGRFGFYPDDADELSSRVMMEFIENHIVFECTHSPILRAKQWAFTRSRGAILNLANEKGRERSLETLDVPTPPPSMSIPDSAYNLIRADRHGVVTMMLAGHKITDIARQKRVHRNTVHNYLRRLRGSVCA